MFYYTRRFMSSGCRENQNSTRPHQIHWNVIGIQESGRRRRNKCPLNWIRSNWFKFGGVEFFKIKMANSFGEQKAWENRTAIYLAASAMAEFIADLFLCPLEAIRIRSVSDSTFPKGLGAGGARILSTDGPLGFYAGLGPILFK